MQKIDDLHRFIITLQKIINQTLINQQSNRPEQIRTSSETDQDKNQINIVKHNNK